MVQKFEIFMVYYRRSYQDVVKYFEKVILELYSFYKFEKIEDRPDCINDSWLIFDIFYILCNSLQSIENLRHD